MSGNDIILKYTGSGGGGAVPEPATVVGLVLTVIAGGLKRLRRRVK
jgi:hypothetical protein